MKTQQQGQRIVIFDGVCVSCNRSVQFIIKHDPHEKFVFAALQSKSGQQLMDDYGLPDDLETIILIADNNAFTQSDAVFRIVQELDGYWPMFAIFHRLPQRLRDGCYQLFGKYRYRLFGKKDVCDIPPKEIRNRFL